jgi:2-keto-4-pentenoate hydratase/2-oxohepta-3-ene-1,7-dioic acid hydratase in catechol pathway
MKIVRYLDSFSKTHFGILHPDDSVERCEGTPYDRLTPTGEKAEIRTLLTPIEPQQIIGIGLNYRKHAEETGKAAPERPVMFVKGVNTAQHPGAPIELPRGLRSDEVDYECELAVVIGSAAKNVSREDVGDYILGYTCANDVSARDHQIRLGGGQWNRGKYFDTFAPLGPCLVTPDELPDPHDLSIATILNGERVQDWRTDDMIFDIPTIVSYLSGSTTLLPGTVILTGTPHGVGMAHKPTPRWLKPGDEVTIEIEKIGALTNSVKEETV